MSMNNSQKAAIQDSLDQALDYLNDVIGNLDDAKWVLIDALDEVPEDERKGEEYENLEALLEAVKTAESETGDVHYAVGDARNNAQERGLICLVSNE